MSTRITTDVTALRDIITSGIDISTEFAIVPDGYKLEGLERFGDAPKRLRGTFKTARISDFAAYWDTHNTEYSALFLDPDSMSAVARIDHGTPLEPGWGSHQAVLDLRPTAGYVALLRLVGGSAYKQADLLDWIADWAPLLQFSDTAAEGDNPNMTAAHAIQALRKLETAAGKTALFEESDLGRQRSVLESAKVTQSPPVRMLVTLTPYAELDARTFAVRLAYLPQDPVMIKPRLVALEATREAMADEFCEKVSAALGVGATLQGKFVA
jgi:uncharacterized protein YfdQ (DUF2303 family)